MLFLGHSHFYVEQISAYIFSPGNHDKIHVLQYLIYYSIDFSINIGFALIILLNFGVLHTTFVLDGTSLKMD